MNTPSPHQELLASMLMRIRAQGVQDNRILKALEFVPRQKFLAPEFAEDAFSSRIFPISCGGYSESVDVLARLLQQLDVQSHHKILEIGCGSGYTTALFATLCEKVHTLDRFETHVSQTTKALEALTIKNVTVQHADGSMGLPNEGTFDRIYVSASFHEMPRHFSDHLISGGVMLAPLSIGNGYAKMMRLTKIGSRFEREDLFEVLDSPIIKGKAAVL